MNMVEIHTYVVRSRKPVHPIGNNDDDDGDIC